MKVVWVARGFGEEDGGWEGADDGRGRTPSWAAAELCVRKARGAEAGRGEEVGSCFGVLAAGG